MLVDPATGNFIQRFGSVGEGGAAGPAFQVSGNNDIKIPVGTSIPGHATSVINLVGNLAASAAGPQAEVVTSAQPFKSGAAAATAPTTLNSLDDIQTPYVATDNLRIHGTATNGAPVDVTIAVGPATTLGDVVTA